MRDMTDAQTPMPETPWWSQPGATAVLPPETEPPAYAPPAPVRERRRIPGSPTAWMLALALLAGGGVGGAVAASMDDDPVSAGTVLSQTTVVGATDTTVSGTPQSAAALISPSVVTVEVSGVATNPFGGTSSQTDTGSGIIIRSSGYILTNNHVVAAAAGGGTVHVTLNDGKTVPATIVGTDPSIDLAVLRITGVSDLHAATFADSARLRVGQPVLAVGAPLGLANTVTQGIVSTLQRPVRTGDSASAQAVFDAVQTDAAINPGNSGGALVDLAGRVVGINSAIATTGSSTTGQSGNIGVGFAIPSNVAVKVADQLIASGKATHSQMGVSVGDAPNSTDGAPGLGAAIRAVTNGGPAQKGGLRAGDIVTKVDDRRVTDADSLIVAIRAHDPGSTVTLTVTRGGSAVSIKVTLASVSS
ncbi:MAG: Peptidase and chymotrypsin/Hap [Frankiales bacterium]|nr:Peptidase and chymotrypsin/Hap [Frankiales bacterium]